MLRSTRSGSVTVLATPDCTHAGDPCKRWAQSAGLCAGREARDLPLNLSNCTCRAALGMYDLELAYMVVANSQLDPGEFLLELQQFEKQPNPSLQRYAIDMHLKRYLAALRHLLAAGDAHFDAAILLAQERVCLFVVPSC